MWSGGREKGKAQAAALPGVSTGKARQGRVDSLGLVSLSNSSGLWGKRAVPDCLILGPGLI